MNTRYLLITAVSFVTTVASQRALAVEVGDKPVLAFTATDGRKVDLLELRGNVVIVDFWSVQDASHMLERRLVELHHEHGHDGVEILGICCDRQLLRSQAMAKELDMSWPQYWDGKQWSGRICQEWGQTHIGCVLIDPDGVVLWKGSPNLIGRQLTNALAAHPPTLVDPATLAAANDALDQATKAFDAKDNFTGLKALADVPSKASKNKPFAARLQEIQPRVELAVAAVLAPVDTDIKAGQNLDAVLKLQSLSVRCKGTAAEGPVKQHLDHLLSDPATSAQLARLQQQSAATTELATAKKLKEQGHDAEAYQRLKAIAAENPGTGVATAAQQLLNDYEKDPVLMQKIYHQLADAKADAGISLARSYAESNQVAAAEQRYRQVIHDFPDTPQAETARKELVELSKK